jgi:hypothetical protein
VLSRTQRFSTGTCARPRRVPLILRASFRRKASPCLSRFLASSNDHRGPIRSGHDLVPAIKPTKQLIGVK